MLDQDKNDWRANKINACYKGSALLCFNYSPQTKACRSVKEIYFLVFFLVFRLYVKQAAKRLVNNNHKL